MAVDSLDTVSPGQSTKTTIATIPQMSGAPMTKTIRIASDDPVLIP
ncbi:MAG: hypothetical protein ACOYLC_02095 [Armatimonadaceae bacterium]